MRNLVCFLLEGFGFKDVIDFKTSTFGFVTAKVIKWSSVLAFIEMLFGVDAFWLMAYALLIILEWVTGVLASRKRGEKHQSRKLGRMLLKIFVYTSTITILNTFKTHSPELGVFGLEINPFSLLYILSIIIIVWQLFVSYLENLSDLGFRWATVLKKVIDAKIQKHLDINNDDNSTK